MTAAQARREDGAVPAAKPRDEDARLAELDRLCILDTGKDPRFDKITGLVAELLDMPIVLVSLVDGAREWFKSTVGTAISEIPRDHGFCAHALLLEGTDTLTVTDTLQDARFATHPYVKDGPRLRFYAGAPLITAKGHKIGMLCVHDIKPRPDFGAEQLGILSKLASIAMDEIEFHRTEHERGLLIGELSHRVKNIFSLVRSVATLSGRGNAAAQPFVAAFLSRLEAMAAAHDKLVSVDWQEARIVDIVEGVVAAHQTVDRAAIRLAILPLRVDPPFAQTLALIVHELLTNSIKHGALQVASGRVDFTVERAAVDTGSTIKFAWSESGGPPPVAPAGSGFGHRLLDMAIRQAGGKVAFDWEPTGLVCRFEVFEQTLAAL